MATEADIEVIKRKGDLALDPFLKFVSAQESDGLHFVHMQRDEDDKDFNLVYYGNLPVAVAREPLNFQPVPPGLNEAQLGLWLDQLIGNGLKPFKSYFNVLVSGKEVSILPCRVGPLPEVTVPGTGWVKTKATIFGLNLDGSRDTQDNGVGAPVLGSIPTANKTQPGCALPQALLIQHYGSLAKARGQSVQVRQPGNAASALTVPIVDIGPREDIVAGGVGIDLTYKTHHDLGGTGKFDVEYHLA